MRLILDFCLFLEYTILVTQTDKKKLIERIINVPKTQKRLFWGREIKSLNELIKLYPEDKFWIGIKFPKKLDSVILLRSGYYSRELKNKYNRYNYKVPTKTDAPVTDPCGGDYSPPSSPKTLKQFLS